MRDEGLVPSWMMILSGAIFAYFGFGMGLSWAHPVTGNPVFFYALLDLTLKISAVAFLGAGALSFTALRPGNVIYSAVGLLGAVSFLVVAVLDFLDKQITTAVPMMLLLLFAAWNGYGSWQSLQGLLRREPVTPEG